MSEYGVRVFLKDGKHEDFDPMTMDDVIDDGTMVLIDDAKWRFLSDDVERIVQYEIENGGYMVWIRKFSEKNDLREQNDQLESNHDDR